MNEELEKFLQDLSAETDFLQLQGGERDAHLQETRSVVRGVIDRLKHEETIPAAYEDAFNAAASTQLGPDNQHLMEYVSLEGKMADLVEETISNELVGQLDVIPPAEKLILAQKLLDYTSEEVDHAPVLTVLDALFPSSEVLQGLTRAQVIERLYEARPDIALRDRHEELEFNLYQNIKMVSAEIIRRVTGREQHDTHAQNTSNLTQYILLRVNNLTAPHLGKDLNPAAVASYIESNELVSSDMYKSLDLSDEEKLKVSLISEHQIRAIALCVLRQKGIEESDLDGPNYDVEQ